MKDQNPRHYYPWPTPPILLLLPLKTPGTCVLSGESAKMTREHWRTKLRRRQNRRRQPHCIQAFVSTHGKGTASIAAAATWGLPRFLSHLSHFDGLNVRYSPRRAGGDTRRSLDACRHECLYTGGVSAAVLPPPKLRTSLFARHSRRFTTQNSHFHSTGDPSHWRSRRRHIAE